MTFTTLGANPRDEVTPDYLLAVALLNITWRPDAVRALLGTWAEKLSEMLAAVSSGGDLWDASDADLAAVDPLWDALLEMPGVGTTTAAKLLARKRPRLCPITDKAVIGVPGRDLGGIALPAARPGGRPRGRGAAPGVGRLRQSAVSWTSRCGAAQPLPRRPATTASGRDPRTRLTASALCRRRRIQASTSARLRCRRKKRARRVRSG